MNQYLNQLLNKQPKLKEILENSQNAKEAKEEIKKLVLNALSKNPDALAYYQNEKNGAEAFNKITWQDFASIRILDYIDYANQEFEDLNQRGVIIKSDPIQTLFQASKGADVDANDDFFLDILHLFNQFFGGAKRELPNRETIEKWMEKYPSGLDPRIIKIREENKERIINVFLDKISKKEITHAKFQFNSDASEEEKKAQLIKWWDNPDFHLNFAIRSPELLNEMLDNSLGEETMQTLYKARDAGIPFFINPYYLSLLNTYELDFAPQADLAIRDYIIYTEQLIEEFGQIVAWEKEDVVEEGKPNAAGWILPSHDNVHRRYPEVAILIPDTVGRACGGLCTSCQRMYGFQKGNLNFDLEKLEANETWSEKLKKLINYYRNDSQLRDVLITGGDALMNTDENLSEILNEIYAMAQAKIEDNKARGEGEKYAEMVRVRLGTRLPVYLPQRITNQLIKILKEFKEKAAKIGLKQFVIQTHFESPMEITPEAEDGIKKLNSAGWIVTNQLVFTAAAARRGHTAKLRKDLNDIGVMPYYTFSVKGYMENNHNFATNARAVQEQIEEKVIGEIPKSEYEEIKKFPLEAENIVDNINKLRKKINTPFLSTDRSVLNLPGVGKSLTFRTIGITNKGRRILEFDHDHTRVHSPIINKLGKIVIIESKPINKFLEQITDMGENPDEYTSLWGYSIGETELRMPIYEYPEYDFKITNEMTNLEI